MFFLLSFACVDYGICVPTAEPWESSDWAGESIDDWVEPWQELSATPTWFDVERHPPLGVLEQVVVSVVRAPHTPIYYHECREPLLQIPLLGTIQSLDGTLQGATQDELPESRGRIWSVLVSESGYSSLQIVPMTLTDTLRVTAPILDAEPTATEFEFALTADQTGGTLSLASTRPATSLDGEVVSTEWSGRWFW